MLELRGPDGSRGRILVEAKANIEPRDVPATLHQLERYEQVDGKGEGGGQGRMVVAPYLSPRTRDLLADAHTGWYDATGNLRVQLDRPALFVERRGADRNPYTSAKDRRLRSLRGPGAGRVVRFLLDDHVPIGVRTLASRSQVGAATSSRVLDLLVRENLIERDREGTVVTVHKRSLAYRWAQDYGLMTANNAVPMLAPRGVDRLLRDLTTFRQPYAVTGAAALRAHLPADATAVAPLTLLTIFVDDAVDARRDLRLRPAERGANVLLVEPFDRVVYRESVEREQVRYVSPGQTVVDLLTGPGRSPEEGRQLLDFLAIKDKEWAL
ncbi:hypothetical protein [Thermomonospora cellulosilytica]|uniref:HTH marR-type domain-containing protein n=1 Tax=Thermomonospora cellulosilytica TaxID=1411118 RepID=A0A7W3R7Q0_9ACTN|nr:hypothetical protein [Thermomonospora cellulosilytica]MBA9002759.1 hypothetical protein [Thermomonospora cellulosilytica]